MNFLRKLTGSEFSNVELHNPLDLLHSVNPELGSLAYARRENILTPDMMPYMAYFRTLQSDEQIKFLEEMTKRAGIDAHEREVGIMEHGKTLRKESGEVTKRLEFDSVERRIEAIQKGESYRAEIVDRGLTKRERISAQRDFEVEKLKYRANAQMVNDFVDGQKYISEQEANARKLEAEAIRDSTVLAHKMQTGALMNVNRIQVEGEVRRALIESQARIRQAEILRGRDIDLAYISQQVAYTQGMLAVQAEEAKSRGMIGQECFRTVSLGLQAATAVLVELDKNVYSTKINTPFGEITMDVKVE